MPWFGMPPAMGAIIFDKNIHTVSKEAIAVAGEGVEEVENTVGKEENKSSRCWKMSISKRENIREVEILTPSDETIFCS